MPTSPHVDFVFQNNNVLQTTPMLGVSCVLARTTKGVYDDPSEIISSYPQFQRQFGKEIVPDGSVSNIEKALVGGSKLRIIRVLGKGATKGVVKATREPARRLKPASDKEESPVVASSTPDPVTPQTLVKITSGSTTVGFGLVTKGYGDPIGTGETFRVGFYKQFNTIYYVIYGATGEILEQGPVLTYKTADSLNNTSFDYLALSAFAKNSQYLEPKMTETVEGIKSWENLIQWLTTSVDGSKDKVTVTIGEKEVTNEEVSFDGTIGNAGTTPTADEWIASLVFVKDIPMYTNFSVPISLNIWNKMPKYLRYIRLLQIWLKNSKNILITLKFLNTLLTILRVISQEIRKLSSPGLKPVWVQSVTLSMLPILVVVLNTTMKMVISKIQM